MRSRTQAGAEVRTSGPLALPVVRPPDPPPPWILARADVAAPAAGAAITPAGVEEGYTEGLRRAEIAMASERRRLSAAIDALGAALASMSRDQEAQVVDLALAIARELAVRAAETDRALAVRLAAAALEDLGRSTRVTLRVAAADRAAIEDWLGAQPASDANRTVSASEDPTLAAGEVVVESELGRVDARLEARLAQIARALREGEPA
jgi:flagellar biosynthesis/type III secretory pathway protein FliH